MQNLALNVAEKGFPISVYNRTYSKTEAAVTRAQKSGAYCSCTHRKISCVLFLARLADQCITCTGLGDKLHGYEHLKDFIASLEKPRYGSFSVSDVVWELCWICIMDIEPLAASALSVLHSARWNIDKCCRWRPL